MYKELFDYCMDNQSDPLCVLIIGNLYKYGKSVERDLVVSFDWFKKAAELGEVRAINNLGVGYEDGIGCEKDLEKAFHYYYQAATLNNYCSMNNVAYCYEYGIGCEINLTEAFLWYKKSAESGYIIAMNNLASMYEKGRGCEQDLNLAFYWYKKSAEFGNNRGMNNLALCYEYSKGCEKDLEQAFYWYKKAAEAGNNFAMNNLALCYEYATGCEKDFDQAFYWYTKAAECGNSVAITNLGYCYENGIGCEIDLTKAFYWFKKGDEVGDLRGTYRLAVCYENGKGCDKDIDQAFKLYLKASTKGYVSAMNDLALCYEYGTGCDIDLDKAFYWYTTSAKEGNDVAMCNLGLCYENGTGCVQNPFEAFYWYEQAAKLGNARAMQRMALCYEEGIGIDKDPVQANYWYEQAANLGNSSAMCDLGFNYSRGIGCDVNYELSVYWYKKAAELDNPRAINNLGVCYEYGDGVEKDEAIAFELYKKAAELGDELAMCNLGYCFEKGTGCLKDEEEAFYWYKKSAEAGNSRAMCNLGVCYQYEIGCEKNLEEAVYWYKKSAEAGNSRGMCNLAFCLEFGEGCIVDFKEAFYWYKKSAEAGNDRGMTNLAECYEDGTGCEVDLNQAFYWYEQSAKIGNSRAMCNLGVCYEYGKGVEENPELAFYWYLKGAENGNSRAMCNLGLCYRDGRGCEQDETQALYWFKCSAKISDSEGMLNLGLCYDDGIGCEENPELAFYWIDFAVKFENINAVPFLAKCYEQGYGCDRDLSMAIELYQKALDEGLEFVQEEYEKTVKLFEEEESKNDNLHYSSRKDVFISWNHLDLKEKENLCNNLEARNIFTVWESDGNGVGDIKRSIENAIVQAKSYIIILTGNSVNSLWVEKEVKIILDKVKANKEYANVIRPVILDKRTVNGQEEEYDVIKGINELNDNSPFKELLNYCATFEDLEVGINYDKIANTIREAISNSLKIEYRTKLVNKFDKFSAALNSVVSSRQTVTGIIAATLEFEKGYLNRNIYDEDGKPHQPNDLIKISKPSLIYGEGGSGKSLYLKNFIRKEFKNDRYIFYLECKELVELVDSHNLMEILKLKSFDNYFTLGEAEFVSQKSFEEFITSQNKIILLIDALDELLLEKRKKLIDKIQVFLTKVPNCKIIFTSRNKLDSTLINSKLHTEVDIYELRGLSFNEIETLYDNLSSKYKGKQNTLTKSEDKREKGSEVEINQTISKESFLKQLETIDEDIKKNPLLISNLIFIYFATNKMPNSSFEIITEAITILLNDLEEERNVNFEYMSYIAHNNLYDLLGSFALQRVNGNMNSAESLIKDYLDFKYPENTNNQEIADAIYKYLRGRAVIVNENISHEIFKNYFVAMSIFNSVYKVATKMPFMKKYYQFQDCGFEYLSEWCESFFCEDNQTWNNIAVDFLYKLDFEIYNLDTKKEMNEKHLSYETFNKTLILTLKEKGFNQEIISALEKLLRNESFHYNEFIKKYI